MVWLRSKTGEIFGLRDGRGFHNPMLAVSAEPAWFKNLSAGAFKNDVNVEVVDPKDVNPKYVNKDGTPTKEYRAIELRVAQATEKSKTKIDPNLARRRALKEKLAKMKASEAELRVAAETDPESAVAMRARERIEKLHPHREAIYEELIKIEADLKMAGADLKTIDALDRVDEIGAEAEAIAKTPPKP